MAYNFDTIAANYDRMNRLMTLGLDRRWRKHATRAVVSGQWPVVSVLDVACGTGDMALLLAERGATVTGVDISEEMLDVARFKVQGSRLMVADAEHLPVEDNTFDAVTCAFGVRNFVHLEQGLNEMLRVLKPSGRMVILELATPDCAIIKPFYNLYTKHIIPRLGQRIADNREAYTYLPVSIEHFPKGKKFLERLGENATERNFTFGICRMYTIEKQRGHYS